MLQTQIKQFLSFLKTGKPNTPNADIKIFILFIWLFYHLVGSSFFILVIYTIEKNGFSKPFIETSRNLSFLNKAFAMIVFAPFIEEMSFRYWQKHVIHNRFYLLILYFGAFVFASIHIPNYQLESNQYVFIPILVGNQFIMALYLSYIRINYGCWWAVMLHSSFNTIWFLIEFVFL